MQINNNIMAPVWFKSTTLKHFDSNVSFSLIDVTLKTRLCP